MLVSKVLSGQGRSALMQERVADYELRAQAYLCDTFPEHHAKHGAEVELALIRSTYGTAKRRGIKRIRDHLQYLALTVYLGAGFERNPLHQRAIHRAGWRAVDGSNKRISSFDTLFGWAGQWQELTALDGDPWPLEALHDEALRLSGWHGDAALLDSLIQIWPNRTMAAPQNALVEFAQEAHAYATSLSLPQGEMLLWATAGLHLGSRFPQDARFQPLAAKMHPTSEAVRPTPDSLLTDLQELTP